MEREALRDYLLSCGWTSDDKKLRWKGQGQRTLREACDEPRTREVRELEDQVRGHR